MASLVHPARRSNLRWLAWLAGVAVVAAGGYYGYHRYRAREAVAAAPPQYITQFVSVGPVSASVSGSGTIEPATTQTINAQVSGTVSKVEVAVGQTVKAGDPLFELVDTQGLAQQVTAAQAALAQAQQQLQQDEDPSAGVDPRTIQQAQLNVQKAQMSLQQAQASLQKDQAAAATDAAVTSPMAGTVQAVSVVAGQQVNAGAQIAVIEPAGVPTLTVPVPEEDLPYLPLGTAVTVAVPALQQTMTGSVTARAVTPSGTVAVNTSGQVVSGGSGTTEQSLYPLTVTLDQPLAGVPAGATASVTFAPQGSPPATYGWTDTGTVSYPSAIAVTAQQAGTVSGLAAQGASVAAGQQVASVTNPETQANLQQDQYAVQQAQIALQQAQISLDQAQSPTPSSPETIASQQAAVQSDQEDLQLRQQALAELTVRAPMDGTVTAIGVQPGEQVGPNTTGVTLQSTAQFQAVVSIDERDIGDVQPGDAATVTVSALPGQAFQGSVASISPTASTSNGVSSYDVTLDLQDQQGLLAGMSATGSIVTKTVQNALRVPTPAVQVGAGGQATLRILENGRPVSVPVQTGLSTAQWTQVLSGAEAGQSVVLGVVPRGVRTAGRSGAGASSGSSGRGGGGFGGAGGQAFGGGGFGPGPVVVARGG